MRKISLSLAIVAALAIFSAFTTTSETQDRYVRIAPGSTDASFELVQGEEGTDWVCNELVEDECVFLKLAPDTYQLHQEGEFTPISR